MVKKKYPIMRVDAKLKKLLQKINKERLRRGLKRLSARKLTARWDPRLKPAAVPKSTNQTKRLTSISSVNDKEYFTR